MYVRKLALCYFKCYRMYIFTVCWKWVFTIISEQSAKQYERWVQGRSSQESESHIWLEQLSPGFLDNSRVGTTRNSCFECKCGLAGVAFCVCLFRWEQSLQQKYHIFFWWVWLTLICEEFDSIKSYQSVLNSNMKFWSHIVWWVCWIGVGRRIVNVTKRRDWRVSSF